MQFPGSQSFQMKPLRTMPIKFLIGLVIGCLLAGGHALGDEKFVIKPPLQRKLESLVLPEFRYSDTDFMDALLYLQKKAQTAPQSAMRVPFVVQLPADFKPRHELTLELKSVSFWGVLRHLCGQAGVEFSIEREAVAIRPLRTASAAPATVRTEIPAPAEPAPGRGLAGPLGKPAQPFATGDNVHRAMSGEIQPEKSGSGKHRNLNGWSVADDPWNKTSMNCIDLAKCKAGRCETDGCGCHICSCYMAEGKKKPESKP
jgi:hypothetical protein